MVSMVYTKIFESFKVKPNVIINTWEKYAYVRLIRINKTVCDLFTNKQVINLCSSYKTSKQTQNICITFIQVRTNVPHCPTLYRCHTNILCWLGGGGGSDISRPSNAPLIKPLHGISIPSFRSSVITGK